MTPCEQMTIGMLSAYCVALRIMETSPSLDEARRRMENVWRETRRVFDMEEERMTTLVRISRNAASWGVTILIDGVQTIAMDARTLAINNANGRFRLKARGTDGSHLAAMVDIVVGPEDPKDYEAKGVPA